MTDPDVYCDYCWWMVNAATHSNGKTYSHGSVVGYVRKLVYEANSKCSKTPANSEFFAVLTKDSEAKWLKQMISNAERDFQRRSIESGQAMKEGAHPLGPLEVQDIMRSYALEGSREAVS